MLEYLVIILELLSSATAQQTTAKFGDPHEQY